MQLDLFSDLNEIKEEKDSFYVSIGNGGKDNIFKFGTRQNDDPYYTRPLKDREDAIKVLTNYTSLSFSDVQKIISKAESEPNQWQVYQTVPDEFFIF